MLNVHSIFAHSATFWYSGRRSLILSLTRISSNNFVSPSAQLAENTPGHTILNQFLLEFTEPLFKFLGPLLTHLNKLPLFLQSQPIHLQPALNILPFLSTQSGQRVRQKKRCKRLTPHKSFIADYLTQERAEGKTILFPWNKGMAGRQGGRCGARAEGR